MYEFAAEAHAGLPQNNPGLWANAIFLPVIAALHEGYRVKSVPVPYRHLSEQTANEQDSPEFEQKRAFNKKVS